MSLGERYEVVSNQESGYGRCDVMVTPRVAGQPGVVLELKVRDDRRGETVERALEQLAARDYAADLRTRGACPVHELAVVFDGKRVFARAREWEGAFARWHGRTAPCSRAALARDRRRFRHA